MQTGQISVVELVEKFKDVPNVLFRMVLQDKQGQWLLHTLVVDVLPDELQKDVPQYHYDYGSVVFIAGMCPGREIGKWLLDKEGIVEGYRFQYNLQYDVNNAIVNWNRSPRNGVALFGATEYPFTLYNVPSSSNNWGPPSDFLIGDKCPFFPTFQSALSRLIYGVNETPGTYQRVDTNESVRVRFTHTTARIQHIEISPTQLAVTVDSTDLANIQLQISSSSTTLLTQHISQPGTIEYPLPDGLPPETWVMLSRGHDWLDYVYLGQRLSPFDLPPKNVTTVMPVPDSRTQLQELIAQGEGPTIEFKQEIPPDHDKMLKTIAAFANGSGGVILLGVEDNTGKIVGVPKGIDIHREKDRIINMIRNTVYPDPQVHLEPGEVNGETIIAIYVDTGTLRPYCLHANKPDYYVRRGATTFIARQEEIRAFIQINIPRSEYDNYGQASYRG